MAMYTLTSRKSRDAADPVARQIETLQRISYEARNQFLGSDCYQVARRLYNVATAGGVRPTFRPEVNVPQLQLLTLNEATDLSSLNPKVYITHDGRRDEPRETAFQAHWRQQNVNNRLMFADIWALLTGVGFLQVGFDAEACRGQGEVWAAWLDPERVYPDPAARSDKEWAWAIVETDMYLDEIRRIWPGPGARVRSRGTAPGPAPVKIGEPPAHGFSLPAGPLTEGPGVGQISRGPLWSGRVPVRVLFTDDYSVTKVELSEADKALKEVQQAVPLAGPETLPPKYKPRYPNGRYIVEAEGVILADGANPFPRCASAKFPVIPIWALPNLTAFWAPPPTRYSVDLQDLAGRMLSQAFENAVRINNAITYIDEATGIDSEDYGGLPGEVRIINMGSRYPEVRWPNAMPQHMVELPQYLFRLQKELHGFTPAREGSMGEGNVGAGLFDASLYQSQFLTRMRSMLLAESVQRLAEMMFRTMARYYHSKRSFPIFSQPVVGKAAPDWAKWEPMDGDAEFDVHLDPGSVRPISQAALRQLVMGLRQAGLISTKRALEALEIPDYAEVAEEVEREQQLAALAKVKRR